MMTNGFQQQAEKLSVAAAGTATFTLKYNQPLERLTIWAISGQRTLSNMTFQPQLNGVSYGGSTNVTAGKAKHLVYRTGGASDEHALFPYLPASSTGAPDSLTFSVLVSNAGAGTEEVTLVAVAKQP